MGGAVKEGVGEAREESSGFEDFLCDEVEGWKKRPSTTTSTDGVASSVRESTPDLGDFFDEDGGTWGEAGGTTTNVGDGNTSCYLNDNNAAWEKLASTTTSSDDSWAEKAMDAARESTNNFGGLFNYGNTAWEKAASTTTTYGSSVASTTETGFRPATESMLNYDTFFNQPNPFNKEPPRDSDGYELCPPTPLSMLLSKHTPKKLAPSILPSTHTPQKQTRQTTPLKSILKNPYVPKKGSAQEELARQSHLAIPKKGSAQEELARQSGLGAPVLRDAAEVLAEQRHMQRKRKRTNQDQPETRKSKRTKDSEVDTKPKPKAKAKKPSLVKAPKQDAVKYKVSELFPKGNSPKKPKKLRLLESGVGEDASGDESDDDPEMVAAYYKQVEVLGYDPMKKKQPSRLGSPFKPTASVNKSSTPKKVTFGNTHQDHNGPMDQSAKSEPSSTSYKQDPDDLFGPPLFTQRRAGTEPPPTSYKPTPRKAPAGHPNKLLVHNTQELESVIAGLEWSVSPIYANRGRTSSEPFPAFDPNYAKPPTPNIFDVIPQREVPTALPPSAFVITLEQRRAIDRSTAQTVHDDPLVFLSEQGFARIPQGNGPINFFVPIGPLPTPSRLRTVHMVFNMMSLTAQQRFHNYPSTGVNSDWLDAAANAMLEALVSRTVICSHAAISASTKYSSEKLRVLAMLGFLPSWWWLREGLIWSLLVVKKVWVDDRNVLGLYNQAKAHVERLVRAEQAMLESAAKVEDVDGAGDGVKPEGSDD
ncbi:hypothetical protein K458DRAFT_437793 [Lentithecium fluviatile CBS 122367]|uniref:Uncharacterized protein n=1 Tax=Lentithecium fluviatile CBS 122367 TaxID=1168545 RepID=A0A6G1IBU4_9PLEO|nr:hypothetical protein K458DRAFT_437793 [Lentithecium fluviatile CBS 122367]